MQCLYYSTSHLGALVAGVASRAVVESASLVRRNVDTVAIVVTERRLVEDAPAAVVGDVDAVVLVVVDDAGVDENVTCKQTKRTL